MCKLRGILKPYVQILGFQRTQKWLPLNEKENKTNMMNAVVHFISMFTPYPSYSQYL